MSVQDFIKKAASLPDWLQKAWAGAKRRGIDALTPEDIDAEIAAQRHALDQTMAEVQSKFADLAPEELQSLIDEAVIAVRKARSFAAMGGVAMRAWL